MQWYCRNGKIMIDIIATNRPFIVCRGLGSQTSDHDTFFEVAFAGIVDMCWEYLNLRCHIH